MSWGSRCFAHLYQRVHLPNIIAVFLTQVGKAMPRYGGRASVVRTLQIAATGLGTGQIYGMLRDIGENPPSGQRKRRQG